MSYEPTLLINHEQLLEHFSKWRPNEADDEMMRIYRHLKVLLEHRPHEIYGFYLCLTQPEGTSFNRAIREQLDDWDVDYWEDN